MRYPSLIRILAPRTGPGVFFKPNQEVPIDAGTVPDPAEALRWVNGGQATALEWSDDEDESDSPPAAPAAGEIETTMLEPPETAVVRRGRPPGRKGKGK